MRKSTVEGQTLEVDQRQIDLDIPRTKISLYKYVLRQQLIEEDADLATEPVALYMNAARNILSAYSVVGNKALRQVSQMMWPNFQRNPRVGYVQGHADVVSFLLGVVGNSEEHVFWIYSTTIER